MKAKLFFVVLALTCLLMNRGQAQAHLDYRLTPKKIAADTYVFVGETDYYSRKNGGNIVNSAFIITADGVVIIDTGPSKLYGEQMRQAIAKITDKPIRIVYNTHHHPDHFFGNQAFADVPIVALAETILQMGQDGDRFADNMYRLVGDWMRGTEPLSAERTIFAGKVQYGTHALELIALSGHDHKDLVIYDHTTGVLFSGDLVFNDMTPTTPHANISDWLASLNRLAEFTPKVLVPGHGEPETTMAALNVTKRYLRWLDNTLAQAAEMGLDMAEVMQVDIPAEFANLANIREEYHRSVAHLWSLYELPSLLSH